jgi:hypothetical protein
MDSIIISEVFSPAAFQKLSTQEIRGMNKLSKKFILPSLAMLLLFNGHLFSDENETAGNSEMSSSGHVTVRSREVDLEKRELIQSRRVKEREEEEAEDQTNAQRILRKACNRLTSSSSQQFMLAPRSMAQPQIALASYPLPINIHLLVGIADNVRSIELEDGSCWEVSPADAYVLRSWRRQLLEYRERPYDMRPIELVITPNYSWFGQYDYYITNKTNNSYVKANLYRGPVAYGDFSHWVIDIDHFSGHIFLSSKTIWCVDPQDTHVIKDWLVNDHIIFGVHNSWLSPYDHILINVNMDEHVRVKQY